MLAIRMDMSGTLLNLDDVKLINWCYGTLELTFKNGNQLRFFPESMAKSWFMVREEKDESEELEA